MSTHTATAPTNYPALDGDVVQQRHTDWCAAHGHATHVVDGVTQDRCPRCGELLITEADLIDVLVHHRPIMLTELGYERPVCESCRSWPCPAVAQARAAAAEVGIDLLRASDEATLRAALPDDIMPCGCAEGMHYCI